MNISDILRDLGVRGLAYCGSTGQQNNTTHKHVDRRQSSQLNILTKFSSVGRPEWQRQLPDMKFSAISFDLWRKPKYRSSLFTCIVTKLLPHTAVADVMQDRIYLQVTQAK